MRLFVIICAACAHCTQTERTQSEWKRTTFCECSRIERNGKELNETPKPLRTKITNFSSKCSKRRVTTTSFMLYASVIAVRACSYDCIKIMLSQRNDGRWQERPNWDKPARQMWTADRTHILPCHFHPLMLYFMLCQCRHRRLTLADELDTAGYEFHSLFTSGHVPVQCIFDICIPRREGDARTKASVQRLWIDANNKYSINFVLQKRI